MHMHSGNCCAVCRAQKTQVNSECCSVECHRKVLSNSTLQIKTLQINNISKGDQAWQPRPCSLHLQQDRDCGCAGATLPVAGEARNYDGAESARGQQNKEKEIAAQIGSNIRLNEEENTICSFGK